MTENQNMRGLAIYGVARMILGIAQLVGLCSGFFFLEWFLRYPSSLRLYLLSQDLVALIFLAVLLRSLFHLFAGIGLALGQRWSIYWLAFGWVIVLIINMGLAYSLADEWRIQGHVVSWSQVFSWGKIGLYSIWILGDWFWVSGRLKSANNDLVPAIKINGAQVAVVLLGSIFFFTVLLFLGRPVKGGFHEGFYKVSGHPGEKQQISAAEKGHLDADRSGAIPLKKNSSERQDEKNRPMSDRKTSSSSGKAQLNGRVVMEENRVSDVSQKSTQQEVKEFGVDAAQSASDRRGISYLDVMGFAGGFFILLAFGLYAADSLREQRRDLSAEQTVFLAVGFFLWTFYGIVSRIWPLGIMSLAVLAVCGCLVWIKIMRF